MKILDHYPIATVEYVVPLPDGRYYTVKPGQVVLTACLRIDGRLTRAFPAFLDSGHNHNFSISEEQLRTWLNIDPGSLAQMGKLRINREEVPLMKADVLVYYNKNGSREIAKTFHEFLFFRRSRNLSLSPPNIPLAHSWNPWNLAAKTLALV